MVAAASATEGRTDCSSHPRTNANTSAKIAQADPLTGWAGSGDTQQQLKLSFPSQEAAIAYAQKQGVPYTVIATPPKTLKLQAYADNFR